MTRPITQSKLTVNGVDLKTPPLKLLPTTFGSAPDFVNIACVWYGDLYGVEYVENLRNMIERNLTIPHQIYCLTDRKEVPEGIKKVRVDNRFAMQGWWYKIGLFQPGLFREGERVLYFDLDVVITGNIDKLVSATDPFCMLENFGPNKAHAAHNSSVMLWTADHDDSNQIYHLFEPQVMKELHGDQCFIWRVRHPEIWNWPRDMVVSYKYEKLPQYRKSTKETCVQVFHGNPKPHQAKEPWVKVNWR